MKKSCCQHGHDHSAHGPAVEATAIDPVCGMTVKTADAPNKADHDGHTYYFCSPRCEAKFTAEPSFQNGFRGRALVARSSYRLACSLSFRAVGNRATRRCAT